jgi:hypothetical protein
MGLTVSNPVYTLPITFQNVGEYIGTTNFMRWVSCRLPNLTVFDDFEGARRWLAFDDVDEVNGGMKLLPGSHKGGVIKHRRSKETSSVLTLELEDGSDFRADNAIQFRLKAGECSLHDDRAIVDRVTERDAVALVGDGVARRPAAAGVLEELTLADRAVGDAVDEDGIVSGHDALACEWCW